MSDWKYAWLFRKKEFDGEPWKYGFWKICKPFKKGCFALFCPCLALGKIAVYVGESFCCYCWLFWLCCPGLYGQARLRSKLRTKQNIQGSGCSDCIEVTCCCCCALSQEYKEICEQPSSNIVKPEKKCTAK